MNATDIKALILCSGISKRLSPIEEDKALINFLGQPLILHHITSLKNAGIRNFVITVNPHNQKKIEGHLAGLSSIKINYVVQEKPKGIANAILVAEPHIINSPFLLLSSNDLLDISAINTIINYASASADYISLITAKEIEQYFPGGYIVTDSDNFLSHIYEKPPQGKEPSRIINIMLHMHMKPNILLNYIATTQSKKDDVYEQALNRMAADYKIQVLKYHGKWHAIKYPWHILDAMDFFAEKLQPNINPETEISSTAIITGPVIIEKGTRVMEYAIIRGPSYIGENNIIGNNTLIRDTFIGNNNVIGFNTEIKHSYIGNNCWFHSNYIGDSVIMDNCLFGAGTVTANLRLDQSTIKSRVNGKLTTTSHKKLGAIVANNCHFGVNSSLMPGIKIGKSCTVGPNVCLGEDLKPNQIVMSIKSKYVKTERKI